MATYEILYWHDIPVQVRARDAHGRAAVPLPERFQQAVDMAAMAAGLTSAEDYTATYRWGETEEREGSALEVAAAVAAELEDQYQKIEWRQTAEALRAESARE